MPTPVQETGTDVALTLTVSALGLTIIALLLFMLVRSLIAFTDVHKSVSINAECDGAAFEQETPRWRMKFQGAPACSGEDADYADTASHVAFNKAYEIFYTWYGKFDSAIVGFGIVLLIACALLVAMRFCAFDDADAFVEYVYRQWDALREFEFADADGVTACLHGFFTPAWVNRRFPASETSRVWWQWLAMALWILPWALLFLLRASMWAFWYIAHAIKANTGGLLDTQFAHVNLVVVVLLLLSYGAFTRSFLDINRWTLADWRVDHGGTTTDCKGNVVPAAEYVPALMGLKAQAGDYAAALDVLGTAWRALGKDLWSSYKATRASPLTPTPSTFRDFLATKADVPATGASASTSSTTSANTGSAVGTVSTGGAGANAAAVLHDWFVRVQVGLQLSDADFDQLLYQPLIEFFDQLAVDGTSSPVDPRRLLGYMLYDADFMQGIKGRYASLYAAAAKVRDMSPENAFSGFFFQQARTAAIFVALIAYFMLLRWSDAVVYYLLLFTLVSTGTAAFAFVVLRMLRR